MDWIQPMEPLSREDAVKGGEWFHEIKWDGIRGMVYLRNREARIFTKRGNERTGFYPELAVLPNLLNAREAVIDGEIIVPDDTGKPSFYSSLVRERVSDRKRAEFYSSGFPAKYVAFDILYRDGAILTGVPIEERKSILDRTLESSQDVTVTDRFNDGPLLFEFMKRKGWEGIVSKKSGSSYIGGKGHRLWYKTKFFKKMLTVAGGIQWKEGMPNSLLLGVFKGKGLAFVGKASTGLTQQHLLLLKSDYGRLETEQCPFTGETIGTGHLKGDISWLKPLLCCWVSFMEFTNDGLMRHPKISGFSADTPGNADGTEFVD